MIMVARHKEDTSWLDVYLSDIPHVVYQVQPCPGLLYHGRRAADECCQAPLPISGCRSVCSCALNSPAPPASATFLGPQCAS